MQRCALAGEYIGSGVRTIFDEYVECVPYQPKKPVNRSRRAFSLKTAAMQSLQIMSCSLSFNKLRLIGHFFCSHQGQIDPWCQVRNIDFMIHQQTNVRIIITCH
jgi:hypothetical protein